MKQSKQFKANDSKTKSVFLNSFDFEEFDTSETISLYNNGLTVTEGNDQDRKEFFSISVLGEMMLD